MKQLLLIGLLMLGFLSSAWSLDHSHAVWTKVLKSYQTPDGLVKYKQLKADVAANKDHLFLGYLSSIQSVTFKDYEGYTKSQKMAFLINAYNALTIKLIIDKYPVKTIKDIGGFFTKPWSVEFFSLLDGKIKSLDPIEHKWLRPNFKDFRIHAAVNCASISCPPLRNEAFVAERLDQQLDGQMRAWLGDKTRNQISSSKKTWKVSKIFDWYESDFKKWGGGVAKSIAKYMKAPPADKALEDIDIEYMDYNWNLNEAK